MKKIIVSVIVFCFIFTFSACKDLSEQTSTETDIDSYTSFTTPSDANIGSQNTVVSGNLETETSVSENITSSEIVSSGTEPSAQTSSKPTTSSATSSNPGGLTFGATGNNVILHPSSGLPFKQLADPETGLSWDGVSPIIYTYPDGTTGTEKKVGATYEQVPGIVATVIDENSLKEEFNPNCNKCGKTRGDGTNGTCVRYSLVSGDMTCSNCGVTIPVKTCHTCK